MKIGAGWLVLTLHAQPGTIMIYALRVAVSERRDCCRIIDKMTDEELHKRFDFLIEQQAQFASDIQKLQDGQAETNKVLNRLAAATLEGFKDVNIKIDALVDSHLRISDSQLRLTESHAQLTDSHTQLTGSFNQ